MKLSRFSFNLLFFITSAKCMISDVACFECDNSPQIGPFHTKPEKFENAALFLRLGLTSTLIRHENGAFQKRSSNQRDLKTPTSRFNLTENIWWVFKVKTFWNFSGVPLRHLACPRWPVTLIFYVSRPSSDTTDSKSVELKFKEPELDPARTPRDYTVHFPQEKAQELSKTYKTSGPVVPDTIRYQ